MAETKKLNGTVVKLEKADITELEIDAFVFYAQHDLALGAGFGTAIAVRGGPKIAKELEELAPLETCEAVVSGAGRLNAEHIIHAVGPRFRETDIEPKLRTTILRCLELAEEKGFARVAFPAMGVGFYGIPLDVSARVTFDTSQEHLKGESGLKELIVCVLDTRENKPFEAALAKL